MKLSFTKRLELGTRKVQKLRRQGFVPVVCYGAGNETNSYTVTIRDLQAVLLSDAVVIDGDGALSSKQVLVQSVEYDPRTDIPQHVDFLFVDEQHEVEHEVPIRVTGEAPAVKKHEGQVVSVADSIVVKALPKNLPAHIEINISNLHEIGAHFVAGDVMLPVNVVLVTPSEEILISIVAKRDEVDDAAVETEVDLSEIKVSGKRGKQEIEENEKTPTENT